MKLRNLFRYGPLALGAILVSGILLSLPGDVILLPTEGPRLVPIGEGFVKPLGLLSSDDESGRIFVLEKGGMIWILQDGRRLEEPFLDLSHRVSTRSELGLLGMAFHPEFPTDPRVFVYYTNRAEQSMLVSFRLDASNPNALDPDSENLLLWFKQPTGNHNGGQLAFGPDGYLYMGIGDGGDRTQSMNGQDLTNFFSTILRLDVNNRNVDDGMAYDIPPDNPFVRDPEVLDEIWAYGLRNPWRFSFDSVSGDLYIGDVGQNTFEEINIIPANTSGGLNFGWDEMEGYECYRSSVCRHENFVPPAIVYSHSDGNSVIGGSVYHGHALSWLEGSYIFGDFSRGKIWVAALEADGWHVDLLMDTNLAISSFGLDQDGEILVADYYHGIIYRLEP